MRSLNFIKVFLVALILSTTFFTTIGNITTYAANKDKEYGGDSGGNQYNSASSSQYSLTGGHTYSDLYASYIFSKQSGKNAASANISYADLEQYPIGGDDDTQTNKAVYGQMKTPFADNRDQKEGLQLASYIKTLHEYDYLVPSPKDSEKDGISTFFKAMWPGSSGDDDRTRLTLRTVLDTAAKGARVYDSFVGLIEAFEKVSVSFNIPTLFKSIVQDGGQKGQDDRGNFLNNIIKNTLGYMGLTDGTIKILQYFIWTVILTMFIGTLILGLSTSQAKQKSITSLKRYGIRILVIILTIPTLLMLHSVMDEIGDSFNKTVKNSPTEFNSNYVVDTLEWAATSNLNLGLLNPGGTIQASGKANPEFKPTPENIGRLMNIVNTRAINSGMLGKDDKQTAASLVSQIANQKTVDVNDYFGMISSKKANDPNIAATNVPMFNNGNTTIARDLDNAGTIGDKKNPIYDGNIKFTVNNDTKKPMFFVENQIDDKVKKAFTKSIETNMKDEKTMGDYQFRTKANEPEPEARKKVRKEFGDVRWVRISNNVVPFSDKSGPVKYFNVKPQDPTQFLYGAIDSGAATQAYTAYDNFIDGPNSMQRLNVVKNEQFTVKDIADKKMSKFAQDAYNNSLRIALMNRYGGITKSSGSGNVDSLSTQSVAFLLQTSAQNHSSLKYDGQNAVPNDEGTGKNSGKNGTGFVRYTIPNDGFSDLISKAGAINIVWLVSGIVAVFAFINLLRAPILGAIAKMFKGFFGAFFTGNIAALLTYMVYYVALRASFLFVKAAIIMGTMFATKLVGSFGVLKSLTSVSKFIPGTTTNVTIIIVSLVVGLILIFPIASFNIGGKPKKLGLLGIMIMLPYLIAESLEDSFSKMYSRIYGKAPGGMLGKRVQGLNPMDELKNTGRSIGKVGGAVAGIAGGIATGGAGFLASAGVGAAGILGKGAEAIGQVRENKNLNDNLSVDGGDGSQLGKVSKFSRFGQTMNSIYDKYRPEGENGNLDNQVGQEGVTDPKAFNKEIDENGNIKDIPNNDVKEALGNNNTKGDPDAPKDGAANAIVIPGAMPNKDEKENDPDAIEANVESGEDEKEKPAIAAHNSNKGIDEEKDPNKVETQQNGTQNTNEANSETQNTDEANNENTNIQNAGDIQNIENVENVHNQNPDIDKETDGSGQIPENDKQTTEEEVKHQTIDDQTVDTNQTDQGEMNESIVRDGSKDLEQVGEQSIDKNEVGEQSTDKNEISDQSANNQQIGNNSMPDASRDGSKIEQTGDIEQKGDIKTSGDVKASDNNTDQAAAMAAGAAAGQVLNRNIGKDGEKPQGKVERLEQKLEKLEKVKEIKEQKVKESEKVFNDRQKDYHTAKEKVEASIAQGNKPDIKDVKLRDDSKDALVSAIRNLDKDKKELKTVTNQISTTKIQKAPAQAAAKAQNTVTNTVNNITNSKVIKSTQNRIQTMKNADNGRMAAGAKQVKDSLTSKDLRDGLRGLATGYDQKQSKNNNNDNNRSNLAEQANQQKSMRQQKQILDELRRNNNRNKNN